MIKFEKIKKDMTLYDVRKSRPRDRYRWSIWPVSVKEVDTERRRVLASWNGNEFVWMNEKRITSFRAKRPKQVYRQ